MYMIKLYLVRHGETDGNSQQWFQGASDVPLNATGIEQARRLSRFMKDIHFDAIYTSTLSRAYTTAKIIAEPHQLPVQQYPELREISFGVWERHTYDEITKQWPGEIEAFYASEGKMRARAVNRSSKCGTVLRPRRKSYLVTMQTGIPL